MFDNDLSRLNPMLEYSSSRYEFYSTYVHSIGIIVTKKTITIMITTIIIITKIKIYLFIDEAANEISILLFSGRLKSLGAVGSPNLTILETIP